MASGCCVWCGLARRREDREDAVVQKRNKSVLCIGNDPLGLNLRCALLKEHGWNVFSSGSGHEGVIRFGQEAVDVVVIDLNEDGTEVALIAGELKRLRPGCACRHSVARRSCSREWSHAAGQRRGR